MGFPTKNDHFGMFWGYPYFWKHPVFGFGGKELLGILVVGNEAFGKDGFLDQNPKVADIKNEKTI